MVGVDGDDTISEDYILPKAVFDMGQGGSTLFRTGSVEVTDIHSLVIKKLSGVLTFGEEWDRNSFSHLQMTKVNIKDSTITIKGNKAYGIYLLKT